MISEVTAVKLREWLESDLPFLKVMRNNVALQAQLLAVAKGSDDAAVRAWLARRTEGTEQTFRVIAEPASNRPSLPTSVSKAGASGSALMNHSRTRDMEPLR